MSDSIKHECGLGVIRLLKPLSYYREKYGTALWGLNKMYLLMEKMHNRGQDGAGLASIKLDVPEGLPYIGRARNNESSPWINLFKGIQKELADLKMRHGAQAEEVEFLKEHFEFSGELMMAHLRYGTHGGNSINYCHPFLRSNNWKSRNLVVAGNFNLTNVDFLFNKLIELGQHPPFRSDTVTVMERIGHFLDEENERLFAEFKKQEIPNYDISRKIAEELDVQRILERSAKHWDGGYVMGGLIGHGDAFVARDPNGIRPAFWYANDELVVMASERPALSTVFNVHYTELKELTPGCALVIRKNGEYGELRFTEEKEKFSCSFERIYFSRGSDVDIYNERKNLGRLVVPRILTSINHDLRNTVFSYIPNTAETAFLGVMKGLEDYLLRVKEKKILEMGPNLDPLELTKILEIRPRVEKAVIKDAKLRTFITNDESRDDLVAHVYDISYGIIREGIDNLVCIDDSIVRGTTLKQSIVTMLSRLKPRKIVIVSSAPQIRYPDCYGIDMSQIEKFVAFQAAIDLLRQHGKENIINETYEKCIEAEKKGRLETENFVKAIYAPFTDDEISFKISEMLTPPGLECKLEIVYQSLEGCHKAIPNHKGDWYFSGDYPTPGGNKVVNRAFINFVEGKNMRAY